MKGLNEVLNKFIGSPNRVKLLRFFISNPHSSLSLKELFARLKIETRALRKEIMVLSDIDFIKSIKKIDGDKWILNQSFPFLKPFKNLILAVFPISEYALLEKFKKVGRLKLFILSGKLIQEENDSKVDILLVGDNVKRGLVTKILKNVEIEVGREINYVLMNSKDFRYRYDIRDKFVREILESPHQTVLDRLNMF